jgi:hypothetical protein
MFACDFSGLFFLAFFAPLQYVYACFWDSFSFFYTFLGYLHPWDMHMHISQVSFLFFYTLRSSLHPQDMCIHVSWVFFLFLILFFLLCTPETCISVFLGFLFFFYTFHTPETCVCVFLWFLFSFILFCLSFHLPRYAYACFNGSFCFIFLFICLLKYV